MSFQAVTWAIEQKTGSPSAKAVLWSIANYANETWCSWPSQKTIGAESEQSVDSVQRRVPELEFAGLIRRIPLKFQGRRSVDFFLLQPSPYFRSGLNDILPLLPRGFVIADSPDTAGCGSVAADCGRESSRVTASPSDVPDPDAAADCGRVPSDAAANATANATALLRQQEPVEPGNLEADAGDARASAVVITAEAHRLSGELARLVGHDIAFLPTRWARDGAYLAQAFLDAGYALDMMRDEVALIMRRKGSDKPESLAYFRRPFAKSHAMRSTPHQLPIVNTDPSATEIIDARPQNKTSNAEPWQRRRDAKLDAYEKFCAASERGSAGGGETPVRLVSDARRSG